MCIAFIDARPKPCDEQFGGSPWLLRLGRDTLIRQLTKQLSLTLGIRRTFVYGRGNAFRDQSFGDLIIHPWPGGIRAALEFVNREFPSKRIMLIDRPLPFARSIDLDTLLCLAHYRNVEESIAIQTEAQALATYPLNDWEFHRGEREVGVRVFAPSRVTKLITDDTIRLPVLSNLGFTIETPADFEYATRIVERSKAID